MTISHLLIGHKYWADDIWERITLCVLLNVLVVGKGKCSLSQIQMYKIHVCSFSCVQSFTLPVFVSVRNAFQSNCCAPLRRLVCLPAEERGAQQLRHRDLLSDGHAEHQRQHAAGALLSDHLWALLQYPEDQRAAGWVSEGQGKRDGSWQHRIVFRTFCFSNVALLYFNSMKSVSDDRGWRSLTNQICPVLMDKGQGIQTQVICQNSWTQKLIMTISNECRIGSNVELMTF